MANKLFAKLTKALAVVMAATVFAAAQPVAAQDAGNPYTFEKKAYKPDGTPWVGPVNVGDTVKYVLSYKPGTAPTGPVTIDDQLSPNLSYLAPTTSTPLWTWGSSPYSTGNHETYLKNSDPSIKVIVPNFNSKLDGDGTKPIPVGNKVFAVYHHANQVSTDLPKVDCWDLVTLIKCPGYPKPNSIGTPIATPVEVNTVVRDGKIFFYGFRSATTGASGVPTIGCFDTAGAGAPCPDTVLDASVTTADFVDGGGLVEDPATGRVFALVQGKIYCRIWTSSAWVACVGPWTANGVQTITGPQPTTTGWSSVAALHVEQVSTPQKIYAHLGQGKVQCIDLNTAVTCAGLWGSAGVTLSISPSGTTFGSIPAGPSGEAGVCVWDINGPVSGCLKPDGSVLSVPVVALAGPTNVVSVFRPPLSTKLFINNHSSPSSTPNTTPPKCYDFGTGGSCSGYSGQNPPFGVTYGFSVDPTKPENCLLGLGHSNVLWRFYSDTGEVGCGIKTGTPSLPEVKLCHSGTPTTTSVTWTTIKVLTAGAQGVLKVSQGSLPQFPITLVPGTSVYPIPSAYASGPAQLQFTFESNNPSSVVPPKEIELEVFYTPSWPEEICYAAKVSKCGPVSNTAIMKGALPAAFSASQTVDLGKAKGEKCDPVIPPVEYSCLSADPKVTCGKTPGTYVVTLTPNSTGSTSPSEFEVTVLTPGVSIQNAQPKYIIGPSGQLQLTLIGANPGDVIEFDISGSQADPKSKDGMSICCVDKIKITIPADLDCTEKQVVDLAIEKKGRKGSATQPNGFIFDLAVTNVGGAIASPAPIQVTDTVPPGMSFSAASGTDWSCGTLPAAAGSTITCTYTGVGNVAAGASLPPIQIQATALGEAPWKPFKNCANVGLSSNATYAETTLANNKSCVVVKDKDEKDPPTISVTKSCTLPTEANAAVVNSKINCQITVTATGSPLPPTINVQESLISNSTSATLSTASISSTEAWSCIPLAGAPVASGTPIDCNLPSSSLPANGVSVLNVTLLVNGPLEPGEAQNCVVGMMQNADGEIATHQQDGTDIPLVTDMQCIPLAQPDGLTVTKVCDPAMPAEGQVDSPGDVVVQCMITVSGAGNLPPVIEVKELLQGVSHPNNAIVQLNSNQNWTMPALPVALGSVGSMTLPSADLMAAGGTSTIAVTLTLNDMGMASETQNCVSGSGGADAASLQEMSPQVCVPFVPQPTGVLKVRKEVINNADFPITGLQYNMTVSCTGNPIPTMSQTIVDGETLDFQSYTPGTECTVQEDPPPATEACGGMTPRWTTTYLPPTTLTNFPNGGTVVVRNTLDCDCPPGHSKGNGKCTKVIDPPKCDTKSAKLSGDSCRCIIRGMVPVSKTSCACPDGQQLKNGACVVPPPPPPKCDARTAKLSGNRCVCTVRGMVPVSKTSCDCPKGQDVRNGKCAPPPPPPPRCDGVTAKAKGNACACTFRNMVPVSKSACACRKGFDFKPGQGCVRRPPLCERGASFNPRRERCEPICGPGTQYNPKRNACIVERRDCPRGQVFIPRLGKCVGFERECPEGTVKFGPVCRPVKGDRDVDNGERCVNREGKEIPC